MYQMTVYDSNGKVLYNKPLTATTDIEAKAMGYLWLHENHAEKNPHRIFHTTGRLISFYPHQFESNKEKNE